MKDLKSIRREYGKNKLLESTLLPDPFLQFESFLNDALSTEAVDTNAMVVSSVDENGFPDSRVLLLKEFSHRGFVFFTHYDSPKAIQLEKSKKAALNFYWAQLAIQIRIKGLVARVSKEESQQYFASRPRESQIATLASHQSTVITSREALEEKVKELTNQYSEKDLICPETWGGYCVSPIEFEFFQGRDNRLNDRIRYQKVHNQWKIERLSP